MPLQLWGFWDVMTAEKSRRRIIKEDWKGVLYSGVLKASK
jgi:hypothetical protein